MRAIMESLFDIAYLVTICILGVTILRRGGKGPFRLFGLMALILGFGDAFHLVPRIFALNNPMTDYVAALGIGKLVTSITMTIFYVLLYHFWCMINHQEQKNALTACVWTLAAVRIALCCFPQNMWTSADAPVSWGIWRNIPFVVLGALIVVLFFRTGKGAFRWMWLAITLSFAFYIPVVLWADVSPMIGMLMLPKTCMYVWAVVMGLRAQKQLG